jgi:two-component system NtrC family sensor kinase
LIDGQFLGILNLPGSEAETIRDVRLNHQNALTGQATNTLSNTKIYQNVEQGKRDWEATFDAMPDAIILLEPDHRIVWANHAFIKMVDRAWHQVIGQPYEAVLAEATCSQPACPLEHTWKNGWAATCIHEYEGWIYEVQTTPIDNKATDQAEQNVRIIYIMRDISVYNEAEHQLRLLTPL